MSDAEQRPRPQYGEYATPEEQRAHIRQPDATFALDAGQAPAAPATGSAANPLAHATPLVPAAAPARSSATTTGNPHPVDRVVTVALLVWGAVNVTFSAISYVNLPDIAQQAMTLMNIPGQFTNVDAARLWGPIGAAVLVVGFVLTLVLALRRLARRRLTWWVPVTGAVITYVLVYVCLSIPLLNDPAFVAYVTSQ